MPTYPALENGAKVQHPFARIRRFRTVANEMEIGRRFTYSFWASAKMAWELSYPAITLAEKNTLVAFFVARKGRYEFFDFVDPGDPPDIAEATYVNCRFDQDELPVQHVGPDQVSMTVRIIKP